MFTVSFAAALFAASGCNRAQYRDWADRNAYHLLKTRQFDSRWQIPARPIEANPYSRLADVHDPDCGPVPPDDPASICYMRHPYNSRRNNYWDKLGQGGPVDSGDWTNYLPYDENGEVLVDRRMSIDLALLHSRDFQVQVEQLYQSALSLSQNRFEFEVNWLGGSSADASLPGEEAAARTILQQNTLGLSREFASGGQLVANLANSFAWQLGAGGSNFAASDLVVSLTQPILRNAFRHVRTEALTQSERQLLYDVRDFARFRREFYLTIVSNYLALLVQFQSIRIEEENLRNLELELDEHRELFKLDQVSQIQVDQVFQSYQSGRLTVLGVNQSFEAALDAFKFTLGLPASVPIRLDETLLEKFVLNSPEIEQLQEDVNQLEQTMAEYLPPEEAPRKFLEMTYESLNEYFEEMQTLKPEIVSDLEKWQARLEENQPDQSTTADDKIEFDQQQDLATRIDSLLNDLDDEIDATAMEIEKLGEIIAEAEDAPEEEDGNPDDEPLSLPAPEEDDDENDDEDLTVEELEERLNSDNFGEEDAPPVKIWKQTQELIANRLSDHITTLFVAQTQIRLFLIDIEPLDADPDIAVEIALENRLDLMNERAIVVDAFRAVEVAADQLESDLDISASANLSTDPNVDNGFRFDGEAAEYTVGLDFDGPLNRLNERNAYRNTQIAYQQQRRNLMAVTDIVTNGVRQDIRSLINDRFSFQVSRQQLIAATRQVEQAQINLRTATEGDSSLTQDLLSALAGLRDAKNGLISSWLDYETSRIQLFVDLELLQLDDRGVWINERENPFAGRTPFAGQNADPVGQPPFEESFGADSDVSNGTDNTNNFDENPAQEPQRGGQPVQPGGIEFPPEPPTITVPLDPPVDGVDFGLLRGVRNSRTR